MVVVKTLKRSITLAQGERNFHVLYELVAGAAKCGLAKDLKASKPFHRELCAM